MTTEKNSAADEAQIRRVIDDRSNALSAKDADRVVSFQAANFTHFSLAPPLMSKGSDAAALAAWFATWQGPIGQEIRDLNIVAGDDTAFSTSLVRLSGIKKDGEKAELWFRCTLCFRKIAGAWKIAHEHESVPFYMDGSFRAAVDLEP